MVVRVGDVAQAARHSYAQGGSPMMRQAQLRTTGARQRVERHRGLRSDVPVIHGRTFSTAGAAGTMALPESSHPAPASTLLPRTGTGAA